MECQETNLVFVVDETTSYSDTEVNQAIATNKLIVDFTSNGTLVCFYTQSICPVVSFLKRLGNFNQSGKNVYKRYPHSIGKISKFTSDHWPLNEHPDRCIPTYSLGFTGFNVSWNWTVYYFHSFSNVLVNEEHIQWNVAMFSFKSKTERISSRRLLTRTNIDVQTVQPNEQDEETCQDIKRIKGNDEGFTPYAEADETGTWITLIL
jgi:hypothetical protein